MGLLRRDLQSQTLRLGDQGWAVRKLQEILREADYDLGSEESYGYLTKRAVRQFQQEHNLVADGIAGPKLFALLLAKNPGIRRKVHVVKTERNITEVAKLYGLKSEAFRVPLKRTLYPGQRLVFFEREIWAFCSSEYLGQGNLEKLTGVVSSDRLGSNHAKPWIDKPVLPHGNNAVEIHEILRSRQKKKTLQAEFLSDLQKANGFYLPWSEVAPLDGARYLRFLKQLRGKIPASQMLWAELGPMIPPWRLTGGVDYERVNLLVDRIVLTLPPPSEPGPFVTKDAFKQALATLLPQVDSWKVLLQIPLYAQEWEVGEKVEFRNLAYETALIRARRYGARQKQDQEGRMFYTYQRRGKEFEIRLPHYQFLTEVASLCNRYNLAGLFLVELGREDPRLWTNLDRCFQVKDYNFKLD